MDDRNNTIMGWVLGAGIVALGLGSLSSHLFTSHAPEKMGFAVEGGAEGGAAADAGPPIETLLASADVGKGEAVFAKCAACHTINSGGANGIGPNLFGILGKPIGKHAAGFAYSPALSGHGGTWDFTTLNAWLTSPRKFADGTKMSFAGLGSAEDRANIMAYINAQGSNLPLPAAPAADAAAAPAGDAAAAPAGDAAPAAGAAAPAAAAPAAAPAH
ncbi:MAG: c-type cytochrome [Sphingopyxis sp.]